MHDIEIAMNILHERTATSPSLTPSTTTSNSKSEISIPKTTTSTNIHISTTSHSSSGCTSGGVPFFRVDVVFDESPAYNAGLRSGDLILQVLRTYEIVKENVHFEEAILFCVGIISIFRI